MKSEKGMTFLSTAILVFVIALLVFGVIYFVRIQAEKEKAEDIKTDMLLVQAKVKTISSEYILEKKDEILKGTKLSDMEENETIKTFLAKELFDPKEKDTKYYVLNQENLNELNLNQVTLKENTYYIVEYTKNKVYYTDGFVFEDGNTYYEIKEIENLEVDE